MARTFDANTDLLSRTDPTGFAVTNAWTFGCWYRSTNAADNRGIVKCGNAGGYGNTRGYVLQQSYVDGTYWKMRALAHNGTGGDATTSIALNEWHRCGWTYNGSSNIKMILDGVQDGNVSVDDIAELTAGDVWQIGYVYSGGGGPRCNVAWPFVIQGVELTASALDNYLNSTGGKTICSLITDYGPSGGITANALKGLWPLQSGDPGDDISGVGNDLTDTGTADYGSEPNSITSCATGISVAVIAAIQRQMRG